MRYQQKQRKSGPWNMKFINFETTVCQREGNQDGHNIGQKRPLALQTLPPKTTPLTQERQEGPNQLHKQKILRMLSQVHV